MDEPSVLDYVKSKLIFWKPSSIHLPDDELEEPEVYEASAQQELPAETILAAPSRADTRPKIQASTTSLLMIGGGLALALLAQAFVEPPSRTWQVSVILYLLAAVIIGAAFFRRFVQPADAPVTEENPANLLFLRIEALIVGFILMLIAFLLFGSGDRPVPEFGLLNTLAWVVSIAYLIFAFLVPGEESFLPRLRRRLASAAGQPAWRLTISRWGLLLLVVTGLVLFFRFYRLDEVPIEMVSDQAEKLLDVSDVLDGQLSVFFPRNTGREAFQFYWTALMVKLFNTGVSFMALKLGTVLGSLLTLFYIYRLGYLVGNRWVALFALLFAGFSYWANIQARIGLRFPLYAMFVAPMLFYLLRGLQNGKRNDFLWAGLWLGIGLHGYTSYRIVPFLVIVIIAIYFLHHFRSPGQRRFAIIALLLVGLISLAVFIPLLRYTLEHPEMVAFRSLSRLSDSERPLPGPAPIIFLQNTWNALVMFFWSNGNVWVHSIPYRPALDVVSAALFFLGLVLVTLRYIRKRSWIDLALLVSIPILLLPSILSLAFPMENPNLNRTTGAYVIVFLILAIGFEALINGLKRSLPGRAGTAAAWVVGLALVFFSASSNFDLTFNQYDRILRESSWNTSEMGEVVRDFDRSIGDANDAWVVAYPYWVDTRLVGINAGFPRRDTAITPEQIAETRSIPRTKLFIVNTQDAIGMETLRSIYPEGRFTLYQSERPGKDFLVYLVPAVDDSLTEEMLLTP